MVWPSGLERARKQERVPDSVRLETWQGAQIGEGTLAPDGTEYQVSARQDQIHAGWHVVRLTDPGNGNLFEAMAWLTPTLQRQIVTLDATRTVLTTWVRARYGTNPPLPESLTLRGPESRPIAEQVLAWETRLSAWSAQESLPGHRIPVPMPVLERQEALSPDP